MQEGHPGRHLASISMFRKFHKIRILVSKIFMSMARDQDGRNPHAIRSHVNRQANWRPSGSHLGINVETPCWRPPWRVMIVENNYDYIYITMAGMAAVLGMRGVNLRQRSIADGRHLGAPWVSMTNGHPGRQGGYIND